MRLKNARRTVLANDPPRVLHLTRSAHERSTRRRIPSVRRGAPRAAAPYRSRRGAACERSRRGKNGGARRAGPDTAVGASDAKLSKRDHRQLPQAGRRGSRRLPASQAARERLGRAAPLCAPNRGAREPEESSFV